MNNKEKIIQELEKMPDNFLSEALDFIRYLKTKTVSESAEGGATAIASESSLQKDWLRPEEEEAWQNL
jgi:hypothetical protein